MKSFLSLIGAALMGVAAQAGAAPQPENAETPAPKDTTESASKKDGDRGTKILDLINSKTLSVDLRAVDAAKGTFGIEYKLDLKKKIKDDPGNFQSWALSLTGEGFLVTDASNNRHDSIVTEAALRFDPLWRAAPSAVQPKKTSIDLKSVKPGEFDPNLGKKFEEILPQVQSPAEVYAKLDTKWETTQDGKDQDFTFGAAIAIRTIALQKILDAPFKLIHGADNNPRALDVSLGYDYVTARKVSDPAAGSGDKNRLTLRAEWETGIFKSDRLVFVFNGAYDIEGSQQGMHPFTEIKYKHLLVGTHDKGTSFSIKYTAGQLAPTYKQGSVIGAGFSIDF